MSDQTSNSQGSARQRTASRLRFVAPPGMDVSGDGAIKKIGRYEIIKMLGKGAMGVVYKARDPFLDRVVAVKTIVSPAASGKRVRSAYIERFQREAKAAAKMQHPSIVTIFDVGVEGSAPFMVLEYLPGESLADRLDRVRMPLGKAHQIGMDLANALAFAHRQRIVHRDVKPANVLHAGENRWKLADFGIARLPDSDLTQVGIFMGTPGYSPPEAIRHGRYTAQADVFAWGAVLYEILCGRIPYEGPDTKTTNGYVIKGDAPDPREYDDSIPEPLAQVVITALSSSPETRYKNGNGAEEALRRAWEQCLRGGLVHPSCLIGDEIPHERVGGAGMHVPRDPARSPAQAPGKPPATPPSTEPITSADAKEPLLVIESSTGRVSDEAPTQVLVRDSLSGRGHSGPDVLAPTTGLPIDTGGITAEHERPGVAIESAAMAGASARLDDPTTEDPPRTDLAIPRLDSEARNWLWAIAVVAALAGGAILAYLLTS